MQSFDKALLIDDIPDRSEPFVEYFVFKEVDFPELLENFDFESLLSEKTLWKKCFFLFWSDMA